MMQPALVIQKIVIGGLAVQIFFEDQTLIKHHNRYLRASDQLSRSSRKYFGINIVVE